MKERRVDKTKKSNIKCEHCKYWQMVSKDVLITDSLTLFGYTGSQVKGCMNPDSPNHRRETNYYNRCKCFDWSD